MVMNDIGGYKSMVTGEWIGSRSQHREHLKAHRLVEIGTETKAHLTKQAPKVDREAIRRDIHTSMQKLGY
jgi:cell division GTPase FtsZ